MAGLGVLVVVALLAAGCGGSASKAGGRPPGSSSPSRSAGSVSVLYAGSLVNLMEHDLGPKFEAATGDQFRGFGAGSSELANEIKGKVRIGDVFISASPKTNAGLEGPGNGRWVSWYATFAKAPLVIGYNPHSRFAAALKAKPWYQVITESGFLLGRTDPKLDPKGKLTVRALTEAASVYQQPGLSAAVQKSSQVFPEQDLIGRLQAGQLDAGFFYANEAKEQHIPTVSLGWVKLSATYTVTVLNRAPDQTAAAAFVSYLLGGSGKAVLTRHGLTVLTPTVHGDAGQVPAALHEVLPGS